MKLFRKEALENRRRKLYGEVVVAQPVSFSLLTLTLLTITIVIVAFLVTGTYSRKEVVRGYLEPELGLSTVTASRGGQLINVSVAVGDKVNVGTSLFESNVDMETRGGSVGERRLASNEKELEELNKQRESIARQYVMESDRMNAKIEFIERELAALLRREKLQIEAADLASAQLDRINSVAIRDVISTFEKDRARYNDIAQKLELESILQNIVAQENALSEAKFSQAALSSSEEKELSRLYFDIERIESSRAELELSSNYVVRSPIAGTVTAVQGAIGQTVLTDAPIVMIVPESSRLEAILLAPSRSIGFLQAGQSVNLKVDAFPYQRFGMYKGSVEHISASPYRPGQIDAPIPYSESVYRVIVKLQKQTVRAYGEEIELLPGMTLHGELITDERTLLQWLIDPLLALKQ